MKYSDRKKLTELTKEQLEEKLIELRKDIFGFRMQKGLGQFGQTHVMAETRHDIARVLTLINSKTNDKSDEVSV